MVVASIRAVLQPQVPGLGELEPVAARAGDTVELEDLLERLVAVGYARVELVEKRGEFAVRGGILDVFPPTEEHPVRVEFWGDDVEEVRFFTVADQRSSGPAEHGLWAPPCRELLLTPPVRERAKRLAAEHPELAEMLDRIADGTAVEGMEALAPVLTDELRLVLHELPAGTHVLVCDPERVRTRAAELVRTSAEFLTAVLGRGGRRRHRADRPRRRGAAHGRGGARGGGVAGPALVDGHPVRHRRRAGRLGADRGRDGGRGVPGGHRAGDRGRARVDPGRLAGRGGLRRARPGAARGRAARRAPRCRCGGSPRWTRRRSRASSPSPPAGWPAASSHRACGSPCSARPT